MYKVDLWVWTDSRSPKEDLKAYAYSIEMRRPSGEIYRKTGEDNISGTWNKAVLTAVANALERFSANAEVTIHTENRWVMNMMEHNLMVWEGADFYKNPKEKVANEAEWRRIAKAGHSLKLVCDPIGFDRSQELYRHVYPEEMDGEG